MFKINFDKRIKPLLLLSLIVIIIGLVACNEKKPLKCGDEIYYKDFMCISSHNIDKTNRKIKFEYENNEKHKNLITPKINIVGNLDWGDGSILQSKLLNDNNVLLYGFRQSYIFESKNNKIKFIPPSSKPFLFVEDPKHYYNTCYKKGMNIIGSEDFFLENNVIRENGIFDLGNNKYFIFPFLVFNSKNQTFSLMPEEWIKKYKQFANNRKFERKDIKYLNTFSNNTFLYGKKTKVNCPNNSDEGTYINELWLEDPVNLKRTKYGKLITNKSDFATVLLKNDHVLIIGGYTFSKEEKDYCKQLSDTIEEYNPVTGEIKKIGKLKMPRRALATVLNDGKVFIYSGTGQSRNDHDIFVEIYDPIKNTTTLVKDQLNIKLIGLEEDEQKDLWFSNNTSPPILLKDGRVLLFSYIPRIYDPKTSQFYVVSDLLTIRDDASITNLENGDVLIVGGTVFYDFVKNIFLNIEEKVLRYTVVERWSFK